MILVLKALLAFLGMFVIGALVALVYGAAKMQADMDDDIDHPWGKY